MKEDGGNIYGARLPGKEIGLGFYWTHEDDVYNRAINKVSRHGIIRSVAWTV